MVFPENGAEIIVTFGDGEKIFKCLSG